MSWRLCSRAQDYIYRISVSREKARIIRPSFELALLGLQSRFGDKLLQNRVECPQNGTAVLEGLTRAPQPSSRGENVSENRLVFFGKDYGKGYDLVNPRSGGGGCRISSSLMNFVQYTAMKYL